MEISSKREMPDSSGQIQNHIAPDHEVLIHPTPKKWMTDRLQREQDVRIRVSSCPIQRSLHVPARGGTVLYGFQRAPILTRAHVSKQKWHDFTKEIQDLINPQRAIESVVYTFLGLSTLSSTPLTLALFIYLYHSRCKDKCRRRFEDAKLNGALDYCTDRWNTNYFEPRGLYVSVEAPDSSACKSSGSIIMENADISSKKLSNYYEKLAVAEYSQDINQINTRRRVKYASRAYKFASREYKDKLHAAKRFRIVVSPLHLKSLETSSPQTNGLA